MGGLGCPLIFFLLELADQLGPNIRISAYDSENVELSNLNRQILFSESDVGRAKIDAVTDRIKLAAPTFPIDLHKHNIETPERISALVESSSIVIDCTDNPALKLQLNDCCVGFGKTFIYTGAVASTGLCFPVVPGGSCLRCLFQGIDDTEEASRREACSSAGIWGAVTGMVALHAAELVLQFATSGRIKSELSRFEFSGPISTKVKVPIYSGCPLGCEHRAQTVTDLREIPCPKNFVVAKLALESSAPHPAAFLFRDMEQLERVNESLSLEGASSLHEPRQLSNGTIRATYGAP